MKEEQKKEITLAQVAERLGVTEATAQRYERGNIKNIPYKHMCAYGEMLNDTGKNEAEKRVEELTGSTYYGICYNFYLER